MFCSCQWSSCAEVAKTVADPTFPGPVVSDNYRKSWGLSQRNHTPDAPPNWTPSPPHSSRQDCASEEFHWQDVCRAVPAHQEHLNPFSTDCQDVRRSLPSVEDCGRPTAVLGSR